MSKTLAYRLHDKIPKLVGINQTGFVKGRFINDTVRTLYDTIENCKENNENGLILMADFKKAFDSLEWNFILRTLEKMNFGQSFIKWIRVFYEDIESCIINNGKTSPYFKVKRGVRQGDPLSPYLFILCVEVLSRAILNDNSINGITVNNTEIKLLQYADDTTAILKNEKSVSSFINQVVNFGKVSGLQMNREKTKGIWLGEHPTFKLPNNIKWSNTPVKVLGVFIGWNIQEANKECITTKIDKLRKILHSWQHRKLTLNGKVLIIKSLAISQIIYLANLLPFPDEYIKQIEMLIYEFLWNGKTHKVKRAVMIQDYDRGGHKMIDLALMIQTQKLKWITLYLNNHNCEWRKLMEANIGVKNLNIYLRSDFEICKNLVKSEFYREALSALYKMKSFDISNTTENIKNNFIFYNKKLKTKKTKTKWKYGV